MEIPEIEFPRKAVIVDIETSSLYLNRGARVIELAAVAIDDFRIVAEFDTLVNVTCWIDPKAQAQHQLDYRTLKRQGRYPIDVFRSFATFIEGRTIIAHNASFEKRFLYDEFNRFELLIPNDFICSLAVAKKLFPKKAIENHRLATLYRHFFGKEPDITHRALPDVMLLHEVWAKLHERYQELAGETTETQRRYAALLGWTGALPNRLAANSQLAALVTAGGMA